MANKMLQKVADNVAKVLLVAGGVNWGLIGLANYNLVETLVGSSGLLRTIVYVGVGASAVYLSIKTKWFK